MEAEMAKAALQKNIKIFIFDKLQNSKQLLDAEATGIDDSFICCSVHNCTILGGCSRYLQYF